MFKNKIEEIKDYFDGKFRSNTEAINAVYDKTEALRGNIISLKQIEEDSKTLNLKNTSYSEVIRSQQKTINTLVEALCGKFENGLFVYSDDGKVPFVIRNGKVLTDKMTVSFQVSWNRDCLPEIEILQDGTTSERMPTEKELRYFAQKDDNL